jgi:endonuclease I
MSLVIAEFDEDLGIPVNTGSGAIARSLFLFKNQFKTVTISCRNSSDQI